jgi:hypothetical protein
MVRTNSRSVADTLRGRRAVRPGFIRSTFVALAAIVGTGAAWPASAQIAPSMSGSSDLKYYDRETGMAVLTVFGRCYAKEKTAKALRLIATAPTSLAERQTYIALFRKSDESCLGDMSGLSADVPLVRGAIAEGLYRGGIPIPPALAQTVPTPAQVRDLSGAARCYAGSHRQEVRQLLAETKPGGRKEFDAVARLMPEFRKCVPPGAKLNSSATVIRFRLAEALLRISVAAAPAEAK